MPAVDGLDVKLLKLVADVVAPAICHIIYLSFSERSCPQKLKIARIIPLPKNGKVTFSGSNSRPIRLSPVLSKIMERIVSEQIKCYFSMNKLPTDFQLSYRKGHSTATALTQMTNDWLKEIEKKKIVGVVLLDFTAAFDVIDQGYSTKILRGPVREHFLNQRSGRS